MQSVCVCVGGDPVKFCPFSFNKVNLAATPETLQKCIITDHYIGFGFMVNLPRFIVLKLPRTAVHEIFK